MQTLTMAINNEQQCLSTSASTSRVANNKKVKFYLLSLKSPFRSSSGEIEITKVFRFCD